MDAFIATPLPPLPDYSVRVPIQRSPRVASPDCGTPAAVRRMAIPYNGEPMPESLVQGWNFSAMQLSGNGQYLVFESALYNLLPDLVFVPHSSWQAVYRVNTQTCQIEVVSQNAGGQVVSAGLSHISDDGRYVVFETWRSLVVADTNSQHDIYVRDMTTGVISLASRNSQGVVGNGYSHLGAASRDGRYIAFTSFSSNLDPADTDTDENIFVFDQQTGETALVPDILQPLSSDHFGDLAISDDGRYVVYQHPQRYPIEVSVIAVPELFLTDRQTQLSVQLTYPGPNHLFYNGKYEPIFSSDGRYIFFRSPEALVPDHNGRYDAVYRYDRITAEISRITPETANGEGGWFYFAISNDTNYLAFLSSSTNLITPDTNGGMTDVYRLDRQTDVVTRVSSGFDGGQINQDAQSVSISDDGRYIAYISRADNVVPNDSLRSLDLFLIDLQQIVPAHTTLVATLPLSRQVDLSWTPHSSIPTEFEVQRSLDGFTNWTALATTPVEQTTYSDTSIGLATTYYYRLRALTLDPNYTAYSTISRIRTPEYLAHTTLAVNIPGYGRTNLSWTQIFPLPATFDIERSGDNGTTWTVIATTTEGQTTYRDTSMVCNTPYRYRLHVLNPHPDYLEYSSSVSIGAIPCTTDRLVLVRSEYNWIIVMHSLLTYPSIADYQIFVADPPDVGQYVMGDWDGDGDDTPGVYAASGVFYFTNTLGTPATWEAIWIGLLGRPAVAGRFSSQAPNDCIGVIDQTSTPYPNDGYGYAIYHACALTIGPTPPLTTTWLNIPLPDSAALTGAIQFGAGDFDGDGIDSLAVRQNGRQATTNDVLTSTAVTCDLSGTTTPTIQVQWLSELLSDRAGFNGSFQFVAGDFNHDGVDSIAVRRGPFITFSNTPPTTLLSEFPLAQYFSPPNRPDEGQLVAGDWNGDATSSFGIFYSDGYFYRRNDLNWNSDSYELQRIGQPIGTPVQAASWR